MWSQNLAPPRDHQKFFRVHQWTLGASKPYLGKFEWIWSFLANFRFHGPVPTYRSCFIGGFQNIVQLFQAQFRLSDVFHSFASWNPPPTSIFRKVRRKAWKKKSKKNIRKKWGTARFPKSCSCDILIWVCITHEKRGWLVGFGAMKWKALTNN